MDMSSNPNPARLRQLSDEVNRIAATLAKLAIQPVEQLPNAANGERDRSEPKVAAETVRHIIRARQLRAQYFDSELFAEPAWDMLLELFHAELAQYRVAVSSLCLAANVPATTALRWIKNMTDAGMFCRRADPHDARRYFIELSPHTCAAMRRYFVELERPYSRVN